MRRGRLCGAVTAGGLRRYATYRAATAAGAFTNTVFGLILVYTYLAPRDARPHLGGHDKARAVTRVWPGRALLWTPAIGGGGAEEELTERIRTGDAAIDLYRPPDLQPWWTAADLCRATFQLPGRGLVPVTFGALFFSVALPTPLLLWRCLRLFSVALPTSAGTWPAFLVAVTPAMAVSFSIRFLVALSSFWLLDGQGVTRMAWLAGSSARARCRSRTSSPACSARGYGPCRGPRCSRHPPTSARSGAAMADVRLPGAWAGPSQQGCAVIPGAVRGPGAAVALGACRSPEGR